MKSYKQDTKEDWHILEMLKKYGKEFLLEGKCSSYMLLRMDALEKYLNAYPFEERFDIIKEASDWNLNRNSVGFDFNCPYCLITIDNYGVKIQSITEKKLNMFFYSCRNFNSKYTAGKEFKEYCIEKVFFEE